MTVAILMPSIPAHSGFLQAAVGSCHAQIYPLEWDVSLHLDSGEGTLGVKINRMVRKCLDEKPATDHFALFDADDLHHGTRLHRQIQPLLDDPSLLLTGSSILTYQDVKDGKIWRYTGSPGGWLGGLAFSVRAWQRFPFADKTRGVDSVWQRQFARPERHDLLDGTLMLCAMHGGNTCPKHPSGRLWARLPYLPAPLQGFSFL